MIQKPERCEPNQTITAANHRVVEEILFLPKRRRPRNPDSRKKAKTPSAASGAPKMSPTKRE